MPDGKGFIWSSEQDGYQHLYWYEANGKLKNN
ncbi:MAG: DPP IV N-terminal domain-containing protein [Saprospiraceae bacterium]|nr:DPP IV N-terminal domain-containing protein [Saprospiraceae bacterium]